ncbi:MAG: transposase, partial [Actinomycetota bacterium]|nr:transposase [Actinomycetota bacterium]
MRRNTHLSRTTSPLPAKTRSHFPGNHQEPQTVFTTDDPTGKLQGARAVKEQLRVLLRTGSLEDAAAEKETLRILVEHTAQPESTRLWRTICRGWNEIEVLIVTGATTAKVEANNTAIKHIKRTGRGYRNP